MWIGFKLKIFLRLFLLTHVLTTISNTINMLGKYKKRESYKRQLLQVIVNLYCNLDKNDLKTECEETGARL